MHLYIRRLLLILVAGLCLAQSSSDLVTPAIRRVGDRLGCLCGSCNNTVATCSMLGCHYSAPARERIAKLQAEGKSDDEIVDDFIKREGKRALAVPPFEGFSILSWIMPFVAVGLGLFAIWAFVQVSGGRFRNGSGQVFFTNAEGEKKRPGD